MLDYCLSHLPTVILLAFFVATLAAAARTLPVQNVAAAACLIALISGIVEAASAKVGIPFGAFFYTENLGNLILHILPWPVPLIWVVAILNSRGTAKLILRPWRKIPNYGIWSSSVTCVLVVLVDLALEPFAYAKHYWLWRVSPRIPDWYGAPWINFAAWGAVTLLILGFILPWLINKKTDESTAPPDYRPFILWLLLVLLLTIANSARSHTLAAAFGVIAISLVTFFGWRHSRK